ncbi:phage tail spike protein [Paraclostridium bifermentans]|uniref:phage tail spike protein n=1 Tax=Paraclostridium bifermentans TaxID=1490 RepID=UPI0025B003F8|nr:phage tail spike protein [Paraclostridium bifermentans]
MLNLHNKDKVKVAGLVDYKNLYIEKELASGDKTLAFSYPKTSKFYFDIEEECYIRTKEDEFIVKEKNVHSDYTDFKCLLNLEDLEGKPFERYASEEQTIDKALALALAGTGWIVGECYLKKKRTVRKSNCSSLEIIKEIRKTYRCDLVFNTLTKTIDVYESLGEDKGTYFIDSLNLKDLSIQGNTYDYFTRIIPIGKDDLRISEINNGKDYVENYQYSNKVKTYYWKDDRYTVIENLKEDAEAKLGAMSKPYRSYSADILNLAKLNNKYKDILDFKLGDTITLISKDNKFRDKQRIVKIIEHPDEHELDSVEISNTTLSFEETQTQFQEAADTINNITTDNGTIDGSTVDGIDTNQITDFEDKVIKVTNIDAVSGKIHNLEATNVTITGELSSVKATIGILETNVATIDKLTVTNSASINELQATKASINQLEVVNASIKVLEANVGKIDTLLNGNLSSENIQAGGITSDKLSISNGFIKNAMIDSLDVSKVNAGDISTNKFRIKSDDGGVEIVGATQQFKDKNNKVRIQMGKDAKGDFNFIIRGEDGTTTLIDHNGIKQKAIADDLIISNMIASDSVGEKQINYSSFTNGFNKDTNTSTLKATKIKLDNQNQSLEVAFNSLKTQADGTKTVTENNSTTINVMQGKITTAINNTQIIKDGQTVLLKDDYNRTVNTVNSMNSTIGSHTTQINNANGKITNVETRVNTVERDLNNITARVSSTESTTTSLNSQMNKLISPHGMPYTKDLIIYGDSNKYYPVYIIGGNQDILRTIKIWRNFSEQAPSDWNTATHKGSLMLTWQGNFGGWGGADYKEFILENSSQYTQLLADCYISVHCMGYTFFLRGGGTTGAIYHFASDQAIDPKVYYNGTSDLVWSNSNPTYNIYAFAPVTIVNTDRLNALKIAKEYSVNKVSNKVSEIEVNLSSITSRVSNVESKQTSTDGKVVSLETWKKEAEQKITDASIVSIVSKQFYSKGETDSKYTTQSQLTQLVNSFEFKFSNNTNDNLLKNSAFLNDFKSWGKNIGGNISIYSDGNFKEGNSVRLELTQENQGIFQTNIDCSNGLAIRIYANASRPVDVIFGIEKVSTKILRIGGGDSWTELKLIIPPINKSGPFVFYTRAGGSQTIYANRFKVQSGNSCTPWSSHSSEIYSTVTKIDTNGIHMDCVDANNRVDIDTGGMYITDKSTNQRLLNITGYGIVAKGGRFSVDDGENGYTLLWGRDIVINGGRAVVGTNFNPEPSLIPNKMYLNYNNDFKNGVEIGGKITNNGKEILSQIDFLKRENGYIRLTNGLIIQWGKITSSIVNGDTVQATIGFPISFTNQGCSLVTSITGVDGQGDLATKYNGTSKIMNNSYGLFYAKNLTPEKWGSSMEINFIAIGY